MKNKMLRILMLTLMATIFLSAAAYASGYIYTTGRCNLREDPSLAGDVITAIPKNTSLYYTETSTDARGVKWFRVKYDYEYGWVSSNFTNKKDDDYNGYVQKDSMPSSGYATTNARINLRSYASTKAAIRTTIPSGKRLHFSATTYDERGICWLKTSYGGYTGWISSRYTEEYGNWDAGHSGAKGYVTSNGSSNVRSKPSLDGRKIGVLSDGETVSYAGSSEYDSRGVKWYKIKFNGQTGWVSSRYTDLEY